MTHIPLECNFNDLTTTDGNSVRYQTYVEFDMVKVRGLLEMPQSIGRGYVGATKNQLNANFAFRKVLVGFG